MNDAYRLIELSIAEKYGASAKGTRKSIGDFLLNDNISQPVNVKSNNIEKNNYSPNIISAKRLIEWIKRGNDLFFIFVDYKVSDENIKIIKDSGLIPFYHISWDCLSIEAQGWGVIQMCKPLNIDKSQTLESFLSRMKIEYEKFIQKETIKMEKIKEMIKDF